MSRFVSFDDVMSVIVGEEYIRREPSLTICILTLKNGTRHVGVNYGAIFPEDHSWEYGEKDAKTQALNKVFESENYLLRQRLMENKK